MPSSGSTLTTGYVWTLQAAFFNCNSDNINFQIMNDIITEINRIIRLNKTIEFCVYRHFNGHIIDLKIDGQNVERGMPFYENFEDWIGYGPVLTFLQANEVWYDFNGTIIMENNQCYLNLNFEGPYEDEFEPIFINIPTSIYQNIPEFDKRFDSNNLYISFTLENNIYTNEIQVVGKHNLLKINLCSQSLEIIRDYLKDYINSNKPILSIPFECEQIYDFECEENTLTTRIRAENIRLPISLFSANPT
jgi:hypothetical protein